MTTPTYPLCHDLFDVTLAKDDDERFKAYNGVHKIGLNSSAREYSTPLGRVRNTMAKVSNINPNHTILHPPRMFMAASLITLIMYYDSKPCLWRRLCVCS